MRPPYYSKRGRPKVRRMTTPHLVEVAFFYQWGQGEHGYSVRRVPPFITDAVLVGVEREVADEGGIPFDDIVITGWQRFGSKP